MGFPQLVLGRFFSSFRGHGIFLRSGFRGCMRLSFMLVSVFKLQQLGRNLLLKLLCAKLKLLLVLKPPKGETTGTLCCSSNSPDLIKDMQQFGCMAAEHRRILLLAS